MEIPKRNVVADSTMINGYVKGILRKSYNLTLFRGSFGGGGGIGPTIGEGPHGCQTEPAQQLQRLGAIWSLRSLQLSAQHPLHQANATT